jgi:hypothetical protein
MVEWCHLGDLRATDSFFEQTVDRAMRQPFNLLFGHRTPLHELATEQAQKADLNLAGLIFHMSRCGSTVVSQMLAALERNVVLSEPAALDQVVRLPARLPDMPQDRLVPLMRGMVAALGRKRYAERDLFIKLDAWHVLLLPLFRRAFPTVPWVFVYREPLEVLSSLARSRPAQMLPGWISPSLLSPAAIAAAADIDAYAVQVLACYLRAAIDHLADGGLLVEYRELPDIGRIIDHLGLHYDEAELAAMRSAALQDAKSPRVRFRPDGAAKREEASEEMRLLAETHLAALHARLEAVRLGTTAL